MQKSSVSDFPHPSSFGKVAVMMGGISGEREVSLESGKNVLKALQDAGVDAFAFDPKNESLGALIRAKPDRVFMILHGQPGEDGRYQAVLDLHGIPYTGSGMLASALTLDKRLSKEKWLGMDLPTPRFKIIPDSMEASQKNYEWVCTQLKLSDPAQGMVIKPSNEGSSLGITIVKDQQDWAEALQNARGYRGEVLAEAYIAGEEYTVTVVNHVALPTVAIRYETAFYDYAAKYTDDRTDLVCPCDLPEALQDHLKVLSIQAGESLYVRGWYRVDFIVSKENKPYLLEINTTPGMTSHSLVPKAAKVFGWDYTALVLQILSGAKSDQVK